ncbi:MAG: CAAX prenyl protease-related protein [Bryobacteraceae bacterium]|nr:CAAX prenyl protease-related protein [Bryobacteraceae bacterium]
MSLRHPAVPYAAPFLYFLLCLAVLPKLGLPPRAELSLWLVSGFAVVFWLSRSVLDFRLRAPLASLAAGAAVFVLWIAPDLLVPGWRSHWMFSNALLGRPESSLSAAALSDPVALALRVARAVLLVPVVEELFWRGWLMRWLEREDFRQVPLGSYHARAFWITAALFALEHGSYWDVGFLAGAAYNAWMVRTKSLADLMLAHAVTNGCLSAYVLWSGRFEYWL